MADQSGVDFLRFLKNFRVVKLQPVERAKAPRQSELLGRSTIGLIDFYAACSAEFGYSATSAPRRVLTKLRQGVHNGGYDNAEHDYICRVGDKIADPDGRSYELIEWLGHGTFGQVLKCRASAPLGERGVRQVAIKVCKNKPAYFHQALGEVSTLQLLLNSMDSQSERHIVKMLDYFVYRKHLCIVFEYLDINLYELLRATNFRGVSVRLISLFTKQLLEAMCCLRDANIIHCDLKPENVLLVTRGNCELKLIDFGSACFERHGFFTYIQSRFYRSPEVSLRLPYTSAIDVWSLGCICAELHLGLPIFPGHSEFDQVCKLIDVLGPIPQVMLDHGRATKRFFRRMQVESEAGDSFGAVAGCSGAAATAPARAPAAAEAAAVAQAGEDQGHLADAGEDGAPPAEGEARPTKRTCRFEGAGSDEQSTAAGSDQARPECASGAAGSASSSGSAAPWRWVPTGDAAHEGVCEGVYVPPRARGRGGKRMWRIKTVEEYERDEHKKEPTPVKKYARFHSLEEMLRPKSTEEMEPRKKIFLQFLQGLLQFNPNERWTPLQATQHAFITNSVGFDPDWVPEPDPNPVPNFLEGACMHRVASGLPGGALGEAVPRLPAEGPFGAGVTTSGFVGGGSARTYNEKVGSAGAAGDHAGPASAPATSRGAAGPTPRAAEAAPTLAPPPPSRSLKPPCGAEPAEERPPPPPLAAPPAAASAASGCSASSSGIAAAPGAMAPKATHEQTKSGGSMLMKGPWAAFASIPLPDSNPSESYRPPIDKISEELMRSVQCAQLRGRQPRSEQQSQANSPHQPRSGAWSVSTGASFCSSASSAGSTPTGPGRRGRGSPHPPRRGRHPHTAFTDWKPGRGGGIHHIGAHSGASTGTPASSPHSSSASANVPRTGRGRGQASRRQEGSHEGSRGSSPWHLQSPSSELSTASDRLNSSQPSGSDSCGEIHPHEGAHSNYDGWEDDPARSDCNYMGPRSAPLSDSDKETPRSLVEMPGQDAAKDSRWGSIPQLSHMLLPRGRLHRGEADVAQSPGSRGGNFREKVGMNEGGPVTPFGPGARREVQKSVAPKDS